MSSSDNNKSVANRLEIRFFAQLKKFADEKGWPFPYYFELDNECSAVELAQLLGLPLEEIEGVFINGRGKPLDKGWVKPGDRVGFIPYGIPGPYRVHFGFFRQKAKK